MSPFILILRGLALFLQTLFAALPLNISFSPHNTESWCLKCPTPFNPLPGQSVAAHCARGPGAGQGTASAQRSAGWRKARLSLAAGAEKNTGAWPGPWLPPPPHAEGWRLVRSAECGQERTSPAQLVTTTQPPHGEQGFCCIEITQNTPSPSPHLRRDLATRPPVQSNGSNHPL